MAENCSIAQELDDAGMVKGAADDVLLEVQGLILALMAERAAGQASQWAPYVSGFLPDDLSHMPMYWTESQLQELRGTAALDKMEGRVQAPADPPTRVRLLWEEVAQPFISDHPHLAMPDGPEGWALYCWATAVVSSYSFILGDDHFQALVPMWDALNHVTGRANVRLNHHTGRRGAGCLQMIATRDIAAGEELINNFGELSQAELLRAYGFVERHDDADKHSNAQVPLRFVLQAVAALRQEEGSPPEAEAEVGSSSEGGSEWDLSDSSGDEAQGWETDEHTGSKDPSDSRALLAPGADGHTATDSTSASSEAADTLCLQLPRIARDDCRRAVRGLPGRLRFLRRTGLLPVPGVFKLFPPGAGSGGHAQQLVESLRLLLLPWRDLAEVKAAVAAWRPGPTAPRSPSRPRTSKRKRGKGDDKAGRPTAGVRVPGALVDVGCVVPKTASRVCRLVHCILEHMLRRYTSSLAQDERLLQEQLEGMDASDASVDRSRLLQAVMARAAEKRCLHALLEAWAPAPGMGHNAAVSRVVGAVAACWETPRPGMFGIAAVGSDVEDSGSEEGTSESEEAVEARGANAVGIMAAGADDSQPGQSKRGQALGQKQETGRGVDFKFAFQL